MDHQTNQPWIFAQVTNVSQAEIVLLQTDYVKTYLSGEGSKLGKIVGKSFSFDFSFNLLFIN